MQNSNIENLKIETMNAVEEYEQGNFDSDKYDDPKENDKRTNALYNIFSPMLDIKNQLYHDKNNNLIILSEVIDLIIELGGDPTDPKEDDQKTKKLQTLRYDNKSGIDVIKYALDGINRKNKSGGSRKRKNKRSKKIKRRNRKYTKHI